MVHLILVLCIASLRHIGSVHFGMAHAVICLLCVEIVSKLFAHSLAWTDEHALPHVERGKQQSKVKNE